MRFPYYLLHSLIYGAVSLSGALGAELHKDSGITENVNSLIDNAEESVSKVGSQTGKIVPAIKQQLQSQGSTGIVDKITNKAKSGIGKYNSTFKLFINNKVLFAFVYI